MCRTSEHGSTPDPCTGAGIIETVTARRPQGHVGGAHDGTAARRRGRLAAGGAGREAAGGGCRDHRAGWGDVKGLWVPLFLSRRAFGGSSCRIVLARRTFRRRVFESNGRHPGKPGSDQTMRSMRGLSCGMQGLQQEGRAQAPSHPGGVRAGAGKNPALLLHCRLHESQQAGPDARTGPLHKRPKTSEFSRVWPGWRRPDCLTDNRPRL